MNRREPIVLEPLSELECTRLLQREHLGRIGIVRDGEPVVFPINYAYDDGDVVFCTDAGSALAACADPGRVAFEIDAVDSRYHAGWSVLVRGRLERVTDENELVRIDALPVRSWVPWVRRRWMRIKTSSVSGRRIRHP